MKRLFLLLIAGVAGWWGYSKLRSHPATADKVAELERQSQLMVDKATGAARSATGQAATRAADIAGTAASGAQEALDTAANKAHEALDTAASKTRQVITPVQDKIAELRSDASANDPTEPGAEHPVA